MLVGFLKARTIRGGGPAGEAGGLLGGLAGPGDAGRGDGVILLDESGRIEGWDQGAAAIFGWPAAEVVGRSLISALVAPRHRELVEAIVTALVRQDSAAGSGRVLELRALHRDGREIGVSAVLARIDRGQEPGGLIATCRRRPGASGAEAGRPAASRAHYRFDTRNTHLAFSCAFMKFLTVHGQFRDFSGEVDLEADDATTARVECRVRTASVDTRSIERDYHLRSPDFFAAERFPELRFRSSSVVPMDDGHFQVLGDLTIRDVTRRTQVEVRLEDREQDGGVERVILTATGSLDRREWFLDWERALQAGRWIVGNEVRLDLLVTLVRRPAPYGGDG